MRCLYTKEELNLFYVTDKIEWDDNHLWLSSIERHGGRVRLSTTLLAAHIDMLRDMLLLAESISSGTFQLQGENK